MAPPSKRLQRNARLPSPETQKQKESRWRGILKHIFVVAASDPDQKYPLEVALTLSLVCRASCRWMRELIWKTVRLTNDAVTERIYAPLHAYTETKRIGKPLDERRDPGPIKCQCIKNLWAASDMRASNTSVFMHPNDHLLTTENSIFVGNALSAGGLQNLAVDIKLLEDGWFSRAAPNQILLMPHLDPDVLTPINLDLPVFRNVTHLIIGQAWSLGLCSRMIELEPLRFCRKLTHLCVRFHTGTTIDDTFTTFIACLLATTSLKHLVCYVDNTFGTRCYESNEVWRTLVEISRRDRRMVVLSSAPSVHQEWERMVHGEKTPWTRMEEPDEREPVRGVSEVSAEDWTKFHGVHGNQFRSTFIRIHDDKEDDLPEPMEVDPMAIDDTPVPPDIAELFKFD
ncbi:hypothetical protein OBBRIDRAFT_853630 [Obba rivulosa]|uniref:Uncharacterized protein n=1 Tax=Obba rivulosa TaxID=1052685 RepID=A0A8E2J3K3_9APHY|nr:hypothetical protein OBBRIDRAFT_853630 [Obba rivulosa]